MTIQAQRAMWGVSLVAFAALNVWAFAMEGLDGLVDHLTTLGPFGILSAVDLVLALVIGMVFVARDARRRRVDARPYLLLTAFTGSLGLLGYLTRHGLGDDER